MKNERRNWVGHCFSRLKNHDKLYIVTIQDSVLQDEKMSERDKEIFERSYVKYKIVCYWGRAGSKLKEKIDSFHDSYEKASQRAYHIFVGKLNKGYSDLSMNDSNYTGTLTVGHPYFEPYLVDEEISMLGDGEQLVKCINNSFMESHFDVDVEYVARGFITKHGKIEVENRFGEFMVVDGNRFQVI